MRGSRADLLQLRSRSGEEYPHERALTQPRIQLGDRSVDQEQNEDPNLDSGKPVPGEPNPARHLKLFRRSLLLDQDPIVTASRDRNFFAG
jgi:hypothetical protein